MRGLARAPSFSLRKKAESGSPPTYETFSFKRGGAWVSQGDFFPALQSLSHTSPTLWAFYPSVTAHPPATRAEPGASLGTLRSLEGTTQPIFLMTHS